MKENGNFLTDYYDPVLMANRVTRHRIEESDSSPYVLEQGEQDPTLVILSKAEQERVKKHSRPKLRRYFSRYLAADLAWQGAALMPDNDEQTANVLNTAGSWLKLGDIKAADRFYQAIERRCPKTEIGKEAIKRHWFVPIPKTEDSEEPTEEPRKPRRRSQRKPRKQRSNSNSSSSQLPRSLRPPRFTLSIDPLLPCPCGNHRPLFVLSVSFVVNLLPPPSRSWRLRG
jgi:hypothetical protein